MAFRAIVAAGSAAVASATVYCQFQIAEYVCCGHVNLSVHLFLHWPQIKKEPIGKIGVFLFVSFCMFARAPYLPDCLIASQRNKRFRKRDDMATEFLDVLPEALAQDENLVEVDDIGGCGCRAGAGADTTPSAGEGDSNYVAIALPG